jgi:hypothetical protein
MCGIGAASHNRHRGKILVLRDAASRLLSMRILPHVPHPEEAALISGLPDISINNVQVGQARLECDRLEG